MNIENIDNIVYNYIFDIEEIKRCWYLYMQCSILIERCNEISKSDKNRIKRYHNDFKKECRKLIKRIDTDTAEIYDYRIDTLILINLHIQKILNKNKYREIKELNKAIENYTRVNNMLGAESALKMFINNNDTAINILYITIYLVVFFIFAYLLKDTIACICIMISAIIIYAMLLWLKNNVVTSYKSNKIKQTICNYTYRKSKKSQVTNKFVQSVILKATEKI